MDTTRKLELTLCGMLPYKLQLYTSQNFHPNTKERPLIKGATVTLTGDLYADIENKTYGENTFKPLLHSLDKLTEPILDGGLIPIVELAKETAWFETNEETQVEYDSDDFDTWCNVYDNSGDKVLWTINFNHTTDCFVQMIPDTPNISYQKECWEFLKKHHFNLYDLPKESYIEKSEVNQNKI